MKKNLLTIVLAAASVPMIFAKSQVPPPANGATAPKPAVTTSTKKHSKKVTKKTAPKTAATSAVKPATPAAGAAVKPTGK